ncbi:MAG: hypothetical protein MJ252_27945 [archaeon]|nr:hypothetical protein [archaeon]
MIAKLIPFDIFSLTPHVFLFGDKYFKTNLGRILSLLAIISYVVIAIVFSVKALMRTDINVVTSIISTQDPLSIQMQPEKIYFSFGLEDPLTYSFVLDEGIYYMTGTYFTIAIQDGKEVWTPTPVELEPCKIEKFGSKYKDLFSQRTNGRYCIKDLNHNIYGTFLDGNYGFIQLNVYPCNETDPNSKCKPKEERDKLLKGTFFSLEYQDTVIDVSNFDEPSVARIGEFYDLVGYSFFREIHMFFREIQVITDKGLLLPDEKTERFVELDTMQNMLNLQPKDDGLICSLTIKAEDKVNKYERNYTKLYTLLANVGGFISGISLVCTVISLLYVNSKYMLTLVNSIFFIPEVYFETSSKQFREGIPEEMKHNKIRAQNVLKKDSLPSDISRQKGGGNSELKGFTGGVKSNNYLAGETKNQKLKNSVLSGLAREKQRKVKLSLIEIYFNSFCQKRLTMRRNMFFFYKGQNIIFDRLDVVSMCRQFFNISRLEKLLLNQDQYTLFNLLFKPRMSVQNQEDFCELKSNEQENKTEYKYFMDERSKKAFMNVFGHINQRNEENSEEGDMEKNTFNKRKTGYSAEEFYTIMDPKMLECLKFGPKE